MWSVKATHLYEELRAPALGSKYRIEATVLCPLDSHHSMWSTISTRSLRFTPSADGN